MSREAGRIRAQANAERLRLLLESRERVELLGYEIARQDRLPAERRHDAGAAPHRLDG